MASTYTTGFGIEKIGSGEQSGAWGTTTNHNLDILDRIASYKAVALSGTTHTLTVREASPGSGTENLQDGMYRVIKFTGALGGNNTVTIAPNTAPAYFIFENATTDSGSSGPYSVILTQGSGANITIQNGKNAIVYCDGAGSGAAVVNALSDLQIATLEVTGAAAIDGALTAAAITATTVTTSGIVSVDDTTTSTSGTTGSIHTDGGLGVAGTAFVAGAATVGGASQFNSTVTVGVNDTGYDVQFFGATSGAHMLWDESADDLKLVGAAGLTVAGNIDVDGTTNLDAVDIDGAVQIDATLSVGVDGTGYDVTFYGDTASRYVKWDESADSLLFSDNAKALFGTGSDLEIFHDGSNSYIQDVSGTGNLIIRADDNIQLKRGGADEKYLQGNSDGSVDLYHNDAKKFETTATGVTVTGGITGVTGINSGQIGGRRNIMYNGAMKVAQRGTVTGATGGIYGGPDRFNFFEQGASVVTLSQDTDVPAGQGFANSMKIDVTTADSSLAAGDLAFIGQRFEGQDLQQLKKGTSSAESVTLSFWVKTTITGTYIIQLYDNDNSRHISKSYTVSSANTWEYKTLTFAGDTTGAFGNDANYSLQVYWWLAAGSTYTGGTLATSWASFTSANAAVGQVNAVNSASNNIYVTGVQMEIGSTATEFEHMTFGEEVALCQRYFQTLDNFIVDAGVQIFSFPLPVRMRATPTFTGGGTGFSSASFTKTSGYLVQNTRGTQQLTISAEL